VKDADEVKGKPRKDTKHPDVTDIFLYTTFGIYTSGDNFKVG
jgi:hypothetical protein